MLRDTKQNYAINLKKKKKNFIVSVIIINICRFDWRIYSQQYDTYNEYYIWGSLINTYRFYNNNYLHTRSMGNIESIKLIRNLNSAIFFWIFRFLFILWYSRRLLYYCQCVRNREILKNLCTVSVWHGFIMKPGRLAWLKKVNSRPQSKCGATKKYHEPKGLQAERF